jgi:hypothetical protein
LKFGAKISAEIKILKAECVTSYRTFQGLYLEFCANVCQRSIRQGECEPPLPATETEHLQRIRTYLGWQPFDDEARARLTRWLTQRATDDLLPRDLVVRAEEMLRTWRVVLPALSTLEELVVSVSTRVQDEI